ncbi:MAG: hypothetical protein ABFD79_11980 [Phycisphaerales bacterium]
MQSNTEVEDVVCGYKIITTIGQASDSSEEKWMHRSEVLANWLLEQWHKSQVKRCA